VSDRRAASKARIAQGLISLDVVVHEVDLAEMLMDRGLIQRNYLHDPTTAQLGLGLAELIALLIAVHKAELDPDGDTSLHGPLKFGKPVVKDEKQTTDERR
jgi:CO dehydrogenase/acetyl-CoA synthase delta subunit